VTLAGAHDDRAGKPVLRLDRENQRKQIESGVRQARALEEALSALSNTLETARVVWTALPFVLRVLRIRAQGPAAPRKIFAGSDKRIRRRSLLHPIHHRPQRVESIERSRSARAMIHPRNEIKSAPTPYFVEPAI